MPKWLTLDAAGRLLCDQHRHPSLKMETVIMIILLSLFYIRSQVFSKAKQPGSLSPNLFSTWRPIRLAYDLR